ncbi:uncharacterized protein RJT21DRAFT_113912 [Scheffersomyces amazonensis]|uniref:uncharacterized protein n=1 Tax=Scheffersomyces amazonensis TaxID=1078765 RepID=UPI00315D0D76
MFYQNDGIDYLKLNLIDVVLEIQKGGIFPLSDQNLYTRKDIESKLNDVLAYYKDGKLFEILTVIPYFQNLVSIPPSLRFIFALTLYRLGRMKPALREMALAIELEFVPDKKHMYISHLQSMFISANKRDNAMMCSGEIMIESQAELMENDYQVDTNISNMLMELHTTQSSLLKSPTVPSDDYFKYGILTMHQQVDMFLQANGTLPDRSLGKLCKEVRSNLSKVVDDLQNSDLSADDVGLTTTSELVFESILSFPPIYLFEDLMDKEGSLKAFLNFHMPFYEKIHYSVKPSLLISRLKKWKVRDVWSIAEVMVVHKTIMGFLQYYREDYDKAETMLSWVYNFLIKIEESFDTPFYSSILSVRNSQIMLIFIGYCKVNKQQHSKEKLSSFLTTLATSLNEIIEEESSASSSLVLCNLYNVYGLVSERLSYLEGKTIAIDDGMGNSSEATYYERKRLICSIKNYIQSVSEVYEDDTIIVSFYDRILWCILLAGGIHIKTLHFFTLLRNHYYITSSYQYLYNVLDKEGWFFQDKDKRNLGYYENGWDIIEKVNAVMETPEVKNIPNIWSSEHGNVLLIPQIYEQNKRLVLLNDSYEIINEEKQFIESVNNHIEPKHKSCLKKSVSQDFSETIIESRSMILTWFESHRSKNKSIPNVVQSFI